ncbi:MAG: radical SAM protein [Magnetococcales bacterium]|nr:radical SAM protein [Magnetococcales bacterium]MBF0149009.1 radical SAM protein [Magnetococcales bacterium]MBF0172058.1 radical SAM protein [Magnetococcales bacterium]MBF0346171.1 radical SAM protein [Magnetococcales bacterium]MBF0630337.1 radical SAM protein [Magnetococcales bacterium]
MVLKKNTLRIVELFPTFRCQLSCDMCSIAKYDPDQGNVLSLDEYRALAKESARMGAFVMTVLGGEPLLYKELPELIRIFKREGFYTSIVTNGLLLTQERLVALKSAGLDCIFMSLESMNEQVNDRIRGKGVFQKVMQGIDLVKDSGILLGISAVMTPDRMEDAIEVIQYCHDRGINSSGGQIAMVGAAEHSEILSPEQQRHVRELLKKYPRLTYDWVFSYFFKQRCPAGKEKIGISSFGDIFGCSYNPLSFGSIRQEPLEEIWQRMQKFTQFSNDFPGCITAENPHYINHYLAPINAANKYPMHFSQHPNINPENHPELFE